MGVPTAQCVERGEAIGVRTARRESWGNRANGVCV